MLCSLLSAMCLIGGTKVHIEVEELTKINTKIVEKLETGREVGRGLPEDYTGGVNRIVVIEGVDRNPCCGTHLPSIHNLQLFLLPHTETLSKSTASSIRLYFVAGPRLITHLTSAHEGLTKTASILSVGSPLVPERVAQLSDERRRADKRVGELEVELAQRMAKDIAHELDSFQDGGVFTKHIHHVDDANALGFLNAVSFAFGNVPGVQEKKYLVVFTSTPSTQASTNTSVILVIGSDDKYVKIVGDGLRAMGIKGGGKGPRWSGKFIGVWLPSREGMKVQETLENVANV